MVQIEGSEVWCDRSFPTWCTEAKGDRPLKILARDGDFLGTGLDQDDLHFTYRDSDGESLALERRGDVLLCNGKPVSLRLSEGGTGWEWLRKASSRDLSDLRLVGIEGEKDSLDFPLLLKLARVRPDIGLFFQDDIDQPDVLRLLSLFEPKVLSIELEALAPQFEVLEPKLRKLRVLWAGGDDYEGAMDFLARLPKLHTLVLLDWEPGKTGGIPSGCRNLSSVTVFNGDLELEHLGFLKNVTSLRELTLAESAGLTDITALGAFPELRKLAFWGCKNLKDLSILERLPKLAWLGFPENTTQEAFAAVVAGHPSLEVVELVGCDDIRDLSPLRSLGNLQAAIVLTDEVDVGVLQDLKSLRYLALPEDTFEDEAAAKIVALERALPDTVIVPAEPFCLGSGWILLLLFPAAAILRLCWGQIWRSESDA